MADYQKNFHYLTREFGVFLRREKRLHILQYPAHSEPGKDITVEWLRIFLSLILKIRQQKILQTILQAMNFRCGCENKIYFLSDRGDNKRNNIWSYDLTNKQTKQITNFDEFDIHFPSIGPNEIVFEAGGLLYLLDLTTEKYREVKINVVTDESTLMVRNENVEKMIQNFSLSYNGNRTLFEARGEIFSVPTENGPVINLTQSSGCCRKISRIFSKRKICCIL